MKKVLAALAGAAAAVLVVFVGVFDGSVDTPFELSVVTAGVGYMIDRHGQWHARPPAAAGPARSASRAELTGR